MLLDISIDFIPSIVLSGLVPIAKIVFTIILYNMTKAQPTLKL